MMTASAEAVTAASAEAVKAASAVGVMATMEAVEVVAERV